MGEEGASFHQNETMNPVGQFILYQNVLQIPFGKNDRNENSPQMGNKGENSPLGVTWGMDGNASPKEKSQRLGKNET